MQNGAGKEVVLSQRRNYIGTNRVGVALVATFVMVLVVMVVLGGARAYNPLPNGFGQSAIEPNPWAEGNVTIATHGSTWNPLEYAASSGEGNLSAALDPHVANPILVNPSDIVAAGTIQQEKAPTATVAAYWNASTYWGHPGAACANTVTAAAVATVNGVSVIQASENATNCLPGVNNDLVSSPTIPVVNYPSSNVAFDYVTMIYGLSGPSCPGGAGTCFLAALLQNSSVGGTVNAQQYTGYAAKTGTATEGANAAQDEIGPGQVGYYSMSLAQLSNAHCGFNDTAGGSNSLSVQAILQLVVPKTSATTDVYTATIYGWEFSTSPFTFGKTTWAGSAITRNVAFGNLNLTSLAPSQPYTSIAGGGYTAAIVERASDLPSGNTTITDAAINVANATSGGPNYIESETFTFDFGLPVAASLSYGSFQLVQQVNISGAQFVSVSFGGTSYTSTFQGYSTCTSTTCTGLQSWHTVQASLSPTQGLVYLAVVYYTGAEWDSISTAPSLLSSSWFQYEWFVFLGLLVTGLGLGSAWVVQGRRQAQIRSPRGVGRLGLRHDRGGRFQMSGHHHAMVWIGVLLTVSALGAIWAIYDGADATGAFATFLGVMIIAVIIMAIAFVAMEISRRRRRRRGASD